MFQKILVPLDDSEVAAGILPYVVQIAKKAGAPLALHTVIDTGSIEVPISGLLPPPSASSTTAHGSAHRQEAATEYATIYREHIEANLQAQAKSRLDSIVRRLASENGIDATASTSIGRPEEKITQVAKEEDCGLIAMSTHGKNAMGRAILGSVTDKVVHSSDLPVLTVSPEKAREFHADDGASITRLILPLDGSALAEGALPFAKSLAQTLSLEAALVRVVRMEHPASVYTEAGVKLPDFTEELERQAAAYLDRTAQRLRDDGLIVQTHVLRGAPAPVLVDFARKTPQSIIVMSSHGRSGLTRWLMGSVAEALVRASGDPVMIIPTMDR